VYEPAASILAKLMTRQGHAHLIPTEVTVTVDGRRITRVSNTSDADQWDHLAAQDDDALRAKFRRFCEPHLAAAPIAAALAEIDLIEQASSVDALVAHLTGR
jgi:hypothetical protein